MVWVPAWHEQLGHVRLIRTTAADREERKKLDKREKKERDEEEERYRTAYNFVKYSLGLRHQVKILTSSCICCVTFFLMHFLYPVNITSYFCRINCKSAFS